MKKLAILVIAAAGTLAAQTCDRACLEGLVDQYIDALIAHKPGTLPVSPKVKNTEDGVRLELGDGFWRTAIGKGTYRMVNADVERGEVVFQGTMREFAVPEVIVMIRLKVVNKQITEIENFVARDSAARAQALEARGKPMDSFMENASSSRADLIKTANAYLSAIEKNDGKGDYSFIGDGCVRVVNGIQVTDNAAAAQAMGAGGGRGGGRGPGGPAGAGAGKGGGAPKGGFGKGPGGPPPGGAVKGGPAPGGPGGPGVAAKGPGAPGGRGPAGAPAAAAPDGPPGFNIYALSCADQLKSGYYGYIARVRDRRFVAADPAKGLVTAIYATDAPSGKFRDVMMKGEATKVGPTKPTTAMVAETFKIKGGKILGMEAVQLGTVPYGFTSGWSSFEEATSSKPRDVK